MNNPRFIILQIDAETGDEHALQAALSVAFPAKGVRLLSISSTARNPYPPSCDATEARVSELRALGHDAAADHLAEVSACYAQGVKDLNEATSIAVQHLQPDDAVPGRPVSEYMIKLARDRKDAVGLATMAAEAIDAITKIEASGYNASTFRKIIVEARTRADKRISKRDLPKHLHNYPGRRPWPGVPSHDAS